MNQPVHVDTASERPQYPSKYEISGGQQEYPDGHPRGNFESKGDIIPSTGKTRDEGFSGGNPNPPLMLDVFSGPNMPLAKAFEWCGWRAVAFDKKISNPSSTAFNHDLSLTEGQDEVLSQSQSATFIAVAFDCSTKVKN